MGAATHECDSFHMFKNRTIILNIVMCNQHEHPPALAGSASAGVGFNLKSSTEDNGNQDPHQQTRVHVQFESFVLTAVSIPGSAVAIFRKSCLILYPALALVSINKIPSS